MRRIFLWCLFQSAVLAIYAQPLPDLDVRNIPDSMKKNAHAVIRDASYQLEIKSADKAYYTAHIVTTILSEAGSDELIFMQFADQFHALDKFSINLLDAQGKSLHTFGKSNLGVQAVGEGLVPEGKLYFLNINNNSYPVTLVTDYEIKYNGILNYPDFDVQVPDASVQKSSFTVKVPLDNDLRYKAQRCNLLPKTDQDGKYKWYSWEVSNLPALVSEIGSVSRNSRYPSILLAPNKFELDGYPGDMSSWKSFGDWYSALAKNAMNLTDDRKKYFQSMVAHASSEKEKIKLLYQYLQNNLRYVSIQLGIGGFRPFDAAKVDKLKYGDCKALSNYMQACLDAVGIKSYQALINAEYNKLPVDPAFPNNVFNHVILCVPQATDTIWLECTSTTADFAKLGSFTENRNALLITPDGGVLVPTPHSRETDNSFHSMSRIMVKEDGSGTAAITLTTTGAYTQSLLHEFSQQVVDEQKDYIVNELGFMQPDRFTVNSARADSNAITHISLDLEKIPAFTAGSKFFISPRIYQLWIHALPTSEKRTQDFYFPHPFVKTDSTIYQLPNNFVLEALPKAKNYQFPWGGFSTSYQFDAQQHRILTTANLVLKENRITAKTYAEVKKLFDNLMAEFNEKIVVKPL